MNNNAVHVTSIKVFDVNFLICNLPKGIKIPFFEALVPAGFPSPAMDYAKKNIDLNELLISHPAGTYFLRVSGTSMIDAHINDDDIVIVDSTIKPRDQNIVIATIDGEFTIKKLQLMPSVALLPMNPDYQPIPISDEAQLQIFGVVTYIIHKAL